MWKLPLALFLVTHGAIHLGFVTRAPAGPRMDVDSGKARMGPKIAIAREQQIPWLLVMGDRDRQANAVSVRLRTDEDLGAMPVDDFVQMAKRIVDEKSLDLK
jgi:threonyl-tRNA synthetase